MFTTLIRRLSWCSLSLALFPSFAEDSLVLDPAVDCQQTGFAESCSMPCHVLDPLGMDPVWSGRVDALLVWRSSPQSLPLFESVPGASVLNTADFGSGMAAGSRFSIFRHTGDQGAVEFTFLRVQSFVASESLPPTQGGYVQAEHGIYCCPSETPLNTIGSGLSSSLQSFELNRRFPTTGRWQWLTGFRWVQWHEDLTLRTEYGPPQMTFQNDYQTTVWNDLYGWQLGADSVLWGQGEPCRIEGIGKAGVYGNTATQRSIATNTAVQPPATLTVATNTSSLAFVGEVGLTAIYDITDRISVRAGYTALWLEGLATAPNQLDHQDLCFSDPIRGATDTGGGAWVQGITLGLEARY